MPINNQPMKKYADITKVDAEKRMVYGYASTEALDSQGEVVKLDAITAALQDYMKFANIREMHQPSAVGVAKEATVDGVGLYIAVKVVDDSAWEKVTEGVYKGFSIGGRVTERDTVNKAVITGMTLTEISLVDRPANPDAVFDVFKAEGADNAEVADETKPDTSTEASAQVNAETVETPASAEEPPKLEFTEAEKEAADTVTLGAVDALAAMLDKGDISPERLVELANADQSIAKGMGGVSWLASLLKNIKYLVADQANEAGREADGSQMPAALRQWLLTGGELLQLMTAEEVAELTGDTGLGDDVIALADTENDIEKANADKNDAENVEKAGARNSKADLSKIQTVHDHAVSLGASCGSEKHDHIADIGKMDTLDTATVEVIKGLGIAEGALFADVVSKMSGRIKELEAMPTIGKAFLRAVSKEADATVLGDDQAKKAEEAIVFEKMTPEEKAHYQLKKMYEQQGRTV